MSEASEPAPRPNPANGDTISGETLVCGGDHRIDRYMLCWSDWWEWLGGAAAGI